MVASSRRGAKFWVAVTNSRYEGVSDHGSRVGRPRDQAVRHRRVAAARDERQRDLDPRILGPAFQIDRGVYAVGHLGLGHEARWLAAVLACGEGAVLSHRSAATFWGIRLSELFRAEVTTGDRRRHEQIATHRARLAAQDRTIHRGIPVTSPARTLADLAHLLDRDELTRALREAMFRRLYDPKAMADASPADRRRP